LGNLRATYDDHLKLIGKRVVDFLLIELFLLGVTAYAIRAIIVSKSAISLQRGIVDPKCQVGRVAPTNHSFSQKTRLNDHLYGIKIWSDFSFVFSQSTRLTDRQTDRIPIADRVCIPCYAVKILKFGEATFKHKLFANEFECDHLHVGWSVVIRSLKLLN